jgi:hypothetical protein
MFIPEPGDYFHVYTETAGLLKATIFRCIETNAKIVKCEFVCNSAGTWPKERAIYNYDRTGPAGASFWPVQPGYRERLMEKYGVFQKRSKPIKADNEFCAAFAKYKTPPQAKASA